MKLSSIVIATALLFGVTAQAQEIKHPEINPDVMEKLFMTSTLVRCEKSVCVDAVTEAPYKSIIEGDGWAVAYDDVVLESLDLSREELQQYVPNLMSMMRGVAKELGADTTGL